MIRYYGLLNLLKHREMDKATFQQFMDIPSTTIDKLWNHEYVSLEVIDEICNKLHCCPSDIMEFVPDIKFYTYGIKFRN